MGSYQTYAFIGIESVNVPAGTFEAVKLEVHPDISGVTNYYVWYAKGVGKIKVSFETEQNNNNYYELYSYLIP